MVDWFSQALCELLSKAGKKLEATTKNKAKFDAFFVTIEKLSKHTKLAPRLKFLLRDVVDLRKSKWIPRRDVLQAHLPHLPFFQCDVYGWSQSWEREGSIRESCFKLRARDTGN